MLKYFLGLNTRRDEITDISSCDVLLVDGLAKQEPKDIDSSKWELVWQGARPSDHRERLWLYRAKQADEHGLYEHGVLISEFSGVRGLELPRGAHLNR